MHFLKGSQRLVVEPHNSAGSSSPFDESWPSTELSTSKTPEGATREPMPGWTNEGWLSPSSPTQNVSGLSEDDDGTPKDGSVIAKYIERFRHGRPSRREERSAPVPAEKPFWWLHSSPTKTFSPGDEWSADRRSDFEYDVSNVIGKSGRTPYQNTSQLCGKGLSHKGGSAGTSPLFAPDQETLRLQERAARLLQRSESSLSSTAPVSSEGLGSSPLSGTTQSDEEATRKPLLRSVADFSAGPVSSLRLPISVTPYQPLQVSSHCRPEEDILYQWRLRRKMEQARDGILPVSTRKKSLSPPVRLSKQSADGDDVKVMERARQQGPRGDTRWDNVAVASTAHHAKHMGSGDFLRSQPVPAHLHHSCDILPCHHQPSQPSESRTGKTRIDRGQPIVGYSCGNIRLEQSQQTGSPDEGSSEELCESSMDVTPVDHRPVERGQALRTTRNRDPQDTSSTWQPGKEQRDYGPSERQTSLSTAHRTAQGDQESGFKRQETEAQGTRKESEKRASQPNAAWREKPQGDPLEGTISSRHRSERRGPLQDSTSKRNKERVTEREFVPEEETRGREINQHKSTRRESEPGVKAATQKISHQKGTGKQCVLEADPRIQVPAHKRTADRAKIPKEEYSSYTSKDREKALADETGAHHPGRVKHNVPIDKTGVRKGPGEPAYSPIRSVLGQVISERLFSPPSSPQTTGDKSKQQFISSDDPRPSTSNTAEHPHMQPLEVATQLLDDAEDSDSTEFEEDPLLHVLRERRNGILRRLRDVDAFITKLESQASSEPPEPD
ncbi:proline and serine-rich protein 3 isoform X2 [Lissotriton helveticus]